MGPPDKRNGHKSTAPKRKKTGTVEQQVPTPPPEGTPEPEPSTTVLPEMTVEEELEYLRGDKTAWDHDRKRQQEEIDNLRNSIQQLINRIAESEASELKAWRKREEALEFAQALRQELQEQQGAGQ